MNYKFKVGERVKYIKRDDALANKIFVISGRCYMDNDSGDVFIENYYLFDSEYVHGGYESDLKSVSVAKPEYMKWILNLKLAR